VFADLDLTQVSMEARVSWSFTPALSLEMYVQPLISAGDYSELKELRTPGTFDFTVYGRDRGSLTATDGGWIADPGDGGRAFFVPDRDFNHRSLRGSAVLRWEYHPGSTLYLIWQHSRADVTQVGDFRLGRDVDALLSARADNMFAVKLSYWLDA
jgi:hypothetical protein